MEEIIGRLLIACNLLIGIMAQWNENYCNHNWILRLHFWIAIIERIYLKFLVELFLLVLALKI